MLIPEEDAIRRIGIDKNGEIQNHVYVDDDGVLYSSVTTVLDDRKDKEKEENLQEWKDKNDGEDGTDHYEDLTEFYQDRGTLCHTKVQEKYSDRKMWDKEHDRILDKWENYDGTIMNEDPYEKLHNDVQKFVIEIHNLIDDKISEVLFVEEFCYDKDINVAGQVDMVYKNKDGDIVVLDFKTSRFVSYPYYLQSNTYANSVESEIGEEVDKLQIARYNPEHNDEGELVTINRDGASIKVTDVFFDEYGPRVAIESPYEAKKIINDLDWNRFKPIWEDNGDEEGYWTLPLKTKIPLRKQNIKSDLYNIKENNISDELENDIDNIIKLDDKDQMVDELYDLISDKDIPEHIESMIRDTLNRKEVFVLKEALNNISNRGWVVNVPDNIEEHINSIISNDEYIKFDNINSRYKTYGEQLTREFNKLAKNRDNDGIIFPEDYVNRYDNIFDDVVIENTLDYIDNNKGNLEGDSPRDIAYDLLYKFGADKKLLDTVFNN